MRRLSIVAIVLLSAASAAAQSTPLTLRQAIAEALAASPALRAPDDGRTLAEIRQRQAAARFGLKLTPAFQTASAPNGLNTRSMGLAVTKQLPTGTAVQLNANRYQIGEGAGQFQDSGYTVGVSQPLLRGWTAVASADREHARRGNVSAARAYLDARQQLVVSVADAYFNVLRARRLLEAADRSLARARRLRTTSEARSKVGLATELDVLRADLLASQSEVALVAQGEALESALDALKTLIGRPIEDDVELADDELADVGTPSSEPVERFIDTALVKRLDVQEAHDRIGDARRTESVARWNLLPPVNVDLSYTKRGIGSGASVAFGQLLNGWHVGVSTSYSLDRSDEAAAAAVAAVSSRAAQRDSADTERRAADEVRRAFRSWARTLTTFDLQSKAVALAERQLRLAEIRYDRGVAGNFDVIDAENNLFQAQSGLVGAQVERALAGLTLRRVTGSLDADTFQP